MNENPEYDYVLQFGEDGKYTMKDSQDNVIMVGDYIDCVNAIPDDEHTEFECSVILNCILLKKVEE